MSWSKVKLKTLLSQPVKNGYSPVCPETPNGKWILSLGALTDSGFDVTQVKPAPIDDSKAVGATTFYIRRAGQFIYGKQNIFRGAFGIIPAELDGYASTQDIPSFDIDASVCAEWLLLYFSRGQFYKRLELYASGSGSKRLHSNVLFNIEIGLPPLGDQKKLAEVLNAAWQEIEILKNLVGTYRKQKCGLMQKLLTGLWRTKIKVDAA